MAQVKIYRMMNYFDFMSLICKFISYLPGFILTAIIYDNYFPAILMAFTFKVIYDCR